MMKMMILKALCVSSVFLTAKAQFVIVRGVRDVFRNLTGCSEKTPHFCYSLHADASLNENCVCQCKVQYPMYRNPDVFPSGGKFVSKGKPGCVWYANHRYECFHIRKRRSDIEYDSALEFDLSKPGNVTVYSDYDIKSCSRLEASVKMPDDSDFKVITGLISAVRLRHDLVRIQWNTANKKYDGAILRGVFRGCSENIAPSDRCFVGKISGVYNGNCQVRAATGECCIFPFTHKGKTYNNCTSVGSVEPWCAVRLQFSNEPNWQAKCANISQATSTVLNSSISQTPSFATFSAVQTSRLSSTVAASNQFTIAVSEITRLQPTSIPSARIFSSANNVTLESQTVRPLSSVKLPPSGVKISGQEVIPIDLLSSGVSANVTPSIMVPVSPSSRQIESSVKGQESTIWTYKTPVLSSLVSPSQRPMRSSIRGPVNISNHSVLTTPLTHKTSSFVASLIAPSSRQMVSSIKGPVNLSNHSVLTTPLTHETIVVASLISPSLRQTKSSIKQPDNLSNSTFFTTPLTLKTVVVASLISPSSKQMNSSIKEPDNLSNNTLLTTSLAHTTPVIPRLISPSQKQIKSSIKGSENLSNHSLLITPLTQKTILVSTLISPSSRQLVSSLKTNSILPLNGSAKTNTSTVSGFLPSSSINNTSPTKTDDALAVSSLTTKTNGSISVVLPLLTSSKQIISPVPTFNILPTSTKLGDPSAYTTANPKNLQYTSSSRNVISSIPTSNNSSNTETTTVVTISFSSSKIAMAISSISEKTLELHSEMTTDTASYATPVIRSSRNFSSTLLTTHSKEAKLFHSTLEVSSTGSVSDFKGEGTVQTDAKRSTEYLAKSSDYHMTVSVENLRPSRSAEVSSVGRTTTTEPTLPNEQLARRRLDIGLILLILAVVGGVMFLLILLVCCVVLCVQNNKKKTHNLPMRRTRSFEMIGSHFRQAPAAEQQPPAHPEASECTSQTTALNSDIEDTRQEDDGNEEIEFTIPEQDYEDEGEKNKNEKRVPSFMTFKL